MELFAGSWEGTGAELHVGIGFVPDFIIGYSASDASIFMWGNSDGDGDGIIGTDHDTAQFTLLTTTGITAYAGGDILTASDDANQDGHEGNPAVGVTMPAGFTVSTDALLNTDSEHVHFVAFRHRSVETAEPTRIDGTTVVHTHESEN